MMIRPLSSSASSASHYFIKRQPIHQILQQRFTTSTQPSLLPMKPGTPIPGLDFIQNKADQQSTTPVSKPRHEYPKWVNRLIEPLSPLAKLNKLDLEQESFSEQARYLKLNRRLKIKENNLNAGLK